MALPITYLYSPFSPEDMEKENNRVLVLLFILKELASNPEGADQDSSLSLDPLAWTQKGSMAQKLREHFSLLHFAFPELSSHIPQLLKHLHSPAKKLMHYLEPYLMACKTDENILLFLLQHQNELAVKPLLDKICPEGIDVLKEKIILNFRQRGYYFTQWIASSKTA